MMSIGLLIAIVSGIGIFTCLIILLVTLFTFGSKRKDLLNKMEGAR